MSGPDFFQTPMGRRFYEHDVPRIASAIERLANAVEEHTGVFTKDPPLPSTLHVCACGVAKFGADGRCVHCGGRPDLERSPAVSRELARDWYWCGARNGTAQLESKFDELWREWIAACERSRNLPTYVQDVLARAAGAPSAKTSTVHAEIDVLDWLVVVPGEGDPTHYPTEVAAVAAARERCLEHPGLQAYVCEVWWRHRE